MKVTIIIGEICSGKTTVSSSFPEEDRVDVGSIVRQLTSTNDRVFDENLDIAISNRLFQIISYRFYRQGGDDLVIAGIRQVSILNRVEQVCKELGVDMEIIYLQVPLEVRRERYIKRHASKDAHLSFAEADKKDHELGLYSLIKYILHRHDVIIKINH